MAIGNFAAERPAYTPRPTAPREITLKPPRFGLCVFNTPSTPTSGVACVSGQRPIAFNSRQELPSDVIWISDAQNAAAAQNFREVGFLRSTPKHIGDDLGVNFRDPVEGMSAVAEVISRVRDIAVHAYPWIDISVDWGVKTMGSAISKLITSPQAPVESTESIFRQAYQSYSMVPDAQRPIDSAGGYGIFSLRTNRLRYADWLCSQSYPNDAWLVMQNKGAKALPMDAFLDPSKPCVVEASVEFINRESKVSPSLIAFGAASTRSKQTLRHWISQPELAWLVQHANVHISSAIVSASAATLADHLKLPRLLTADPVYALSLSAGVLAECHWTGISSENFVRRPGPSGTQRFVTEVRPHAVWMRAYDRAYSFQMACAVSARGYTVTGYGYGAVNFWAPKDRLLELAELADEIGACHPNLSAMHERLLSDASTVMD